MVPAKLAFTAAAEIQKQKEAALEHAVNHYFEGAPWHEGILGEVCHLEIRHDGVETFIINGVPMVEFGPILSRMEADGNTNKVTCYFAQAVKRFY